MITVGTYRVLHVPFRMYGVTDGSAVNGLQSVADDAARWYRDASYGKCTFTSTVVPYEVFRSGTSTSIEQDVINALKGTPYDYANFDRVCIHTIRWPNSPPGTCWGKTSWINCANSSYQRHATVHELGHSFGLGHAGSIRVGSRSGSTFLGPALGYVGGATRNSTGDSTSTMGYQAYLGHYTVDEKLRLGWLPASAQVAFAKGDQTYALTPVSVAGGALYGVRIPMSIYLATSSRVYHVERRARAGSCGDAGFPDDFIGVLIRISDQFGDYRATRDFQIMDMNYATEAPSALRVGEYYTDGSVTIEATADGVRVHDAGIAGGTTTGPVNLCRGAVTSASTYESGYPASAVNDGNTVSPYWRSTANPCMVQCNWGASLGVQSVGRIVIYTPSGSLTDFDVRGVDANDQLFAIYGVVGNAASKIEITLPAPVLTKRVRLEIHSSTGYARVAEIEAYAS